MQMDAGVLASIIIPPQIVGKRDLFIGGRGGRFIEGHSETNTAEVE